MWPEALAGLVEQINLLLHQLARLMPMTEKLLSSKDGTDAALAEISEGVPRAFRQIIAADTAIHDQLKALRAKVENAAAEARGAQMVAELAKNHAAEVERQLRRLSLWVKAGVSIIVVLLLATIMLLVGR